MKVIQSKRMNGINASVLVTEDEQVEVVYDDKVIFTSDQNTWNNIKNAPWLIEGTLEMAVKAYTEEHAAPSAVFQEMCKQLSTGRQE